MTCLATGNVGLRDARVGAANPDGMWSLFLLVGGYILRVIRTVPLFSILRNFFEVSLEGCHGLEDERL